MNTNISLTEQAHDDANKIESSQFSGTSPLASGSGKYFDDLNNGRDYITMNKGPNRAERRRIAKETMSKADKINKKKAKAELDKSVWDDLVVIYTNLRDYILESSSIVATFKEAADKANMDLDEFLNLYMDDKRLFDQNLKLLKSDVPMLLADLEAVYEKHKDFKGKAVSPSEALTIVELTGIYVNIQVRIQNTLEQPLDHLSDLFILTIEKYKRLNEVTFASKDLEQNEELVEIQAN